MINRTLAPEIKLADTVTLPQAELLHLDNGVPVYGINSGDQEVVKIELIFKAGKWYEDKNLVSDFTNRMLREGTRRKTALQIADEFDYHGANINYGAAFENAGATLYSLTHQAGKLLPLLYELFTEATFPEAELNTVLNNRRQRLKVDLEKNDFIANRHFVDALYGQKHPYGRITQFADLDSITTNHLKDFYRAYYNPASLIIMVSGRYDKQLITQLNNTFGSKTWQAQPTPEAPQYPVEGSKELVLHTEKEGAVQTAIAVGCLSINKHHPDYMKLMVLNTIYGGYFGSRLMSNIREEKGYTYGIYSTFVSYPHGGFFEISSEVGKDVYQATLKEIEHEMNVLRNEPVGDEELQTVKNYLTGKVMRSIDGPLKFSETLKGLIVYGQKEDYIHQMLHTIRTITADELLQLANKYFHYNNMYKVTVG